MAQRLPKGTNERRPAGYQRTLRRASWLTLLGTMILNSGSSSFGGPELLAAAVAIGTTIWCAASPLGPPKIDFRNPGELLGEFAARVNWALVTIGSLLTAVGVAAGWSIVYDLATGRASAGDIARDIAVFAEGWFAEIFSKGVVDAQLEHTRAYALVFLLLPGPLLLANIAPVFRKGRSFRVLPDGSVQVSDGAGWLQLDERDYDRVKADGAAIRFLPAAGGRGLVLEQARAFSREHAARLPPQVSAAFFRRRLEEREFVITDETTAEFDARRAAE